MDSLPQPVQLSLFVLSKRCPRCEKAKPLADFNYCAKARDGRQSTCADCNRAYHKARSVAARPAKEMAKAIRAAEKAAYLAARTHKTCGHCQQSKPLSDFSLRTYIPDGYAPWCKTCQGQYRRAHAAEIEEKNRAWRYAHPENMQAIARRNFENHRVYFRAKVAKRRARKVSAEGSYTDADVRTIYYAQKGLCAYCGVAVGDTYHIDHRIPLARGGTNWPSNLAISCPRCNLRKNDLTDDEFRARHNLMQTQVGAMMTSGSFHAASRSQ